MPNNTPSEINFKTCTKCGETKPTTAFSKDVSKKDGLCCQCKACVAFYYAENREKRLAYNANYYMEHRDEKLNYCAAYRESHRDEQAAYSTKYRAEHLEEVRAYSRVYEASHREERQAYRIKHRNQKSAYCAAWQRANPIKVRANVHRYNARKRGNGGSHTAEDVKRQGDSQAWKCWWCGKRCKSKYHVDHLIPLARGGHNGPTNLVIACPKCNCSKNDKLPDEWAGRLF
jgi:5-methylcytosine-specific restriction endonuclease McrA